MESLRKNLSAYTLDDAPEDVRELYKDEFIQLYASSIKCFFKAPLSGSRRYRYRKIGI